jgi:ArsR family transcriptional regulator
MCVCELQAVLNLAQPTVSKHLKILEEAGLVDFKKDGLWVNYFLADGKSSPYAANLLGNLQHWLNEDAEIAELMKKAPYINRIFLFYYIVKFAYSVLLIALFIKIF